MQRETIGRRELLYNDSLLESLADEHGNAIDIKEAVDTPAHVYEIRTALEYWLGGSNTHRESDAIWRRCEAIEEGTLELHGNTFVHVPPSDWSEHELRDGEVKVA